MSDANADPQRVAVFVGTRADLGPLSRLLAALARDERFELHVLTGVAYAAADLRRALVSMAAVPPDDEAVRVHELAPPMAEISAEAQIAQGARISEATGNVLRANAIDVLVVLGDRWELLYVVPPAVLLGVPLVHLHGGEVTEGAIDDRIRHAVSQLGDEHCAASPDAVERLLRFGVAPEHVHLTGAPGLDRVSAAAPITDAELASLVGLPRVSHPLGLFTYHPPTALADAPVGEWATAAAEAALEVCGTVVATHPGIDAGRDEILAALEAVAERVPDRFALVTALGAAYPQTLAAADVVVGNSSSGVIEAASLGVPAVDIGERQRGRLRGENVVHAEEGHDSVAEALRLALSEEHRARSRATVNPYGDGHAVERIVAVIAGVGKDAKA